MTVSEAAYGFRVDGIRAPEALALSGASDWPLVRVRTAPPMVRTAPLGVRDDTALVGMPPGVIALDRRSRSAVIETPDVLEPDELVHPYLWRIGAVMARWQGRETFHAGGVVIGGGAWGVLGDSGDGKSSLLAWLAVRAGLEILTDDLLVVHENHAHAGPRCLDLRPEAATGLSLDGRLVRCTQRRRVTLPPAEGRVPLLGWVLLEWGSEVAVERVPPPERLFRLRRFRRGPELGADGAEWLGLIGLPMVVLRRPRRWDSMDEAGWRLLDELAPVPEHPLPA
jgi:hypothetical protein